MAPQDFAHFGDEVGLRHGALRLLAKLQIVGVVALVQPLNGPFHRTKVINGRFHRDLTYRIAYQLLIVSDAPIMFFRVGKARKFSEAIMDQDRLLSALEKHFDQTENVLNTFVVIAVIALFAGVSGADPIEAGGLKIPRKDAFVVLGLVFTFANFVMLMQFLRIGDVINSIDSEHAMKALSIIGLHKWLFNPFSYFGDGLIPRLHSATGFGSCIVIWWLGFSSLQAVSPGVDSIYNIFPAIYLGVGLSSMFAVNRGYMIIHKKASQVDSGIASNLMKTMLERTVFTFSGIALGGLVANFAGYLHFGQN